MKYDDNGVWKTLNVKVTDTLPVGTIIPYAGSTVPSNYMLCEGQELSRIEYDILFNAIGTTYGVGDGATTFNLPNLKGRIITGIDSNDTDFDTLGETGGEKTHTLTVDEIPSHAHEQLAISNPNSGGPGIRGTYNEQEGTGMSRYPTNTQTGTTGGGEAHNNLQPYIVLNYIIKVLDAPAIQAQVVNGYSTSSRDSYSCNYMNSINGYSTDEIQIGVDEENKPIYKKTYITNENTGSSTVDISTLNAKEIKDYNSVCYRKGTNNDYEHPYYAGDDDYFRVFFRTNSASSDYPTSIQYRIASSYSSFKIKTTIYYTKTTD